jgi:hypothetical protein
MSDMFLHSDLNPSPAPAPFVFERSSRLYTPQERLRPSSGPRVVHAPPIRHALATVTLGTTIEYRGLAVTALIGDDDPACDYLLVEEALSRGAVTIREVSAYGAMNQLHVFNRADKPLLIVDGQELAGSVQNRVINLSVLIRPQRDALIPVSCVERGRCAGQTYRFTSASRMQFASGRAKKMADVSRSLSSRNERQSNQAAIWHAIHEKTEQMQVGSNTEAMAAIYEQHAVALQEYVEALGHLERWRGALFAVHGHLAGLELFDSASTWLRLLPQIVRSYAVEALDEPVDQQKPLDSAPSALLDVLAGANTYSFATCGDGFDVRIKGRSVRGAALVFGARIVHLAAFTDVLDMRSLPPWLLLSNRTAVPTGT